MSGLEVALCFPGDTWCKFTLGEMLWCFCHCVCVCPCMWVCTFLMRHGAKGHTPVAGMWNMRGSGRWFKKCPSRFVEVIGHQSFVTHCTQIPPTVDLPAEPEQINITAPLEFAVFGLDCSVRRYLQLLAALYLPDGLQIASFFFSCLHREKWQFLEILKSPPFKSLPAELTISFQLYVLQQQFVKLSQVLDSRPVPIHLEIKNKVTGKLSRPATRAACSMAFRARAVSKKKKSFFQG